MMRALEKGVGYSPKDRGVSGERKEVVVTRCIALLVVVMLGASAPALAAGKKSKISKAARAVLEKAIESMGGDAALAAVKGMRMHARGTFKAGPMESEYTAETIYVAPNRLVWKLDAPGFQGAAALDGDTAWSQMMGPPGRVRGAAKDAYVEWLVHQGIYLVRPLLHMEEIKITAAKPKERKETKIHRLRIKLPHGTTLSLRFVEREGKTRLTAVSGDSTLPDGRKGRMKASCSKPKRFGNITLPSVSKATVFYGEKLQETIEEQITAIDWNPEVPEGTFQMPKLGMPLMKASVKTAPEGQGIMLVHKGTYDRMGETIRKASEIALASGLMRMGPIMAIYLNSPREAKDPAELKTEIVFPVMVIGDPPKLPEVASWKKIGQEEVASMTARGPYGEADVQALRKLFEWIPANGYQISGLPRTVFYHSPETTVGEDLVSEVQIPVRKQS